MIIFILYLVILVEVFIHLVQKRGMMLPGNIHFLLEVVVVIILNLDKLKV
ncbi:MAG: hypothetical protein H8E13_11485 [Actinobacteria bacterium]|nr:hypothetical protein [Actinomycetota bacterium]